MSKPQNAQRTSSPFGNPFRMILPKHSYSSRKQLTLLTAFEQTLAERLRNLIPKCYSDVTSFSWMRRAMKSLCETHVSIKTLINALNFPVSEWDEKWMELYLDNSVKVLDICNALTSELSKLDQSQIFLKYALRLLDSDDTSISRVHKSLHGYMEKAHSENPKLEKCFSILQELSSTLQLVKVKNSAKGKLLMRALYGVKVLTIFVCNVFMVSLSCCSEWLMNMEVSGDFLWAQAFNELQAGINGQMNSMHSSGKFGMIKEIEVVNSNVEKLHSFSVDMDKEEAVVALKMKELTLVLASKAECFSVELVLLSKQVEEFFGLVIEGRNALFSSFLGSDVQTKGKFGNKQGMTNNFP